jgi:hypothetical protein
MNIMKRLERPAGETPPPGDLPRDRLYAKEKEAAPAIPGPFKAI